MKKYKFFVISLALFVLFVAFTLTVVFADRQAIGPNESIVGFATLNGWAKLPFSQTLYKITDITTVVALLPVLFFVCLGIIQLIKAKSFKGVDLQIYLLGAFYVVTCGFYLLFEGLEINFRPILIDGELESSYPSTTVLVTLCVVSTALLQVKKFQNKRLKIILYVIGGLFAAVTVVLRLLSGVHWLTDILGAIILSAALVVAFYAASRFVEESVKTQEQNADTPLK